MFNGIFAPIPTPFQNDALDFDALAFNLERWAETPLTGVVVLGSNGEFAYLSYDEKLEVIRFVRDHWPEDRMLIAGTGCESTRESIALTRVAAECGCDAVLVLSPHYYKGAMTVEALSHFYCSVADASPVPVLLYNMPKNTGLNLHSDLVIELARHPNIKGLKDSSGNIVQIAEICAGTPSEFEVLAGSGSFLLPALAVGAVGGVMAVANIMAETCWELLQAFTAGNLDRARELQHILLEPNATVTARFGVAGLKAALDMLGYRGGEVRSPMLPASPEVRNEIAEILRRAGLIH